MCPDKGQQRCQWWGQSRVVPMVLKAKTHYDTYGQYCWLHFPFNQTMTPDSEKYIATRENVPEGVSHRELFPEILQ